MEQQSILGMAGVGFIGMLLIGFLAGWIAERAMNRDHGLLTNILVGIAGSFVGGTLAGLLGFQWHGFLGNLVIATIGAIGILWIFGKRERVARPDPGEWTGAGRSEKPDPSSQNDRPANPYEEVDEPGNSPIYHAKSDPKKR